MSLNARLFAGRFCLWLAFMGMRKWYNRGKTKQEGNTS